MKYFFSLLFLVGTTFNNNTFGQTLFAPQDAALNVVQLSSDSIQVSLEATLDETANFFEFVVIDEHEIIDSIDIIDLQQGPQASIKPYSISNNRINVDIGNFSTHIKFKIEMYSIDWEGLKSEIAIINRD